MKRGQISVEYLIVVGFILFVVAGLMTIAFFYAASVQDELKSNQVENFANKVVTAAENVFFSGDPSQVTITGFIPDGVIATNITNDGGKSFLVISFNSNTGTSTIAFSSDVPIQQGPYLTLTCENGGLGRCDEGVKKILVKARANDVQIQEVT